MKMRNFNRSKTSVLFVKPKAMVLSCTTALIILAASFVNGIGNIDSTENDQAKCRPQQVHIAYGDGLDQIVVVWATEGNCSTHVEFTTNPWAWKWKASGNSSEFWEQNVQGLHNLHRVKLSNLQQNTTYYYRPLSNGVGSGPFFFKTPRTDVNWSPRFLVFGDLGLYTQSIPTLVAEALKGEYTAAIHAGDMAYNLKDDNGLVGDQFMAKIEPFAAFLPYMTCPGNHEIDSDTFIHYRHRFSMPGSPWPMAVDHLWYSFNVGPAHFISYSSEVFFTNGGAYVQKQFDWLVADLRQATKERTVRPWIIAFGHRPMYCSANDGDDCTKNVSLVRSGLEELFYGFGVDLILQAHEHNYERLYPMYREVVMATSYLDPPAPVQIISGAAGSKHGLDSFQKPPKPHWSAVRVEETALNSYGRLHVVNGSHVYWEQRSIHSDSVLDSLWIVQHRHRKFTLPKASQNVSSEAGTGLSGVTLSPNLFEDEDPDAKDRELKQSDMTQRLAISVSFGVLFAILVVVAILSRACRRRQYTAVRRWNAMDLDYGQRLFSSGRDNDLPELEQDFELDMGDMSAPSSTKKLLNNS